MPKTIDNDLSGTDACFGFDTAVMIATEAVDRLHSTTEAHSRVQVVEVMGRDAGWIAVTAGIAGGADVILTPEHEIDMDDVVRLLRARWECGKRFGIVVVAEGAKLPDVEGQITVGDKLDSFGHARLSGIGQVLAEEIEKRTGYETRSVNLGHTQRGGTPTAYDRMLATRYGIAAIDMVHEGKFGRMAVLKGTKICDISIADAIAQTRTVGEDIFAVIRGLQPAEVIAACPEGHGFNRTLMLPCRKGTAQACFDRAGLRWPRRTASTPDSPLAGSLRDPASAQQRRSAFLFINQLVAKTCTPG